ncbi:hypothetical protein ACLXBB_37215, partial [Pseudomonas aeruginosa]
IGDRHQLWHYNPRVGPPRLLPAGVYGLSNAALDTPWPKLLNWRSPSALALQPPRRATAPAAGGGLRAVQRGPR